MSPSSGASATPSPALLAVLARFEALRQEIPRGGVWSCDGGAGVLQLLCEQAGVPAELRVGLYHWPEERLAEKWGLLEGGEATEEDLDGYWDDEHHHWVEADGLILDPNGEIRGEPRCQPDSSERYESFEIGQWGAWDKVLSWSPYYSLSEGDDPEPICHDPREAAAWIGEIAAALESIEAAAAISQADDDGPSL